MADAIIASTVKVVVEKAISLAAGRIGSMFGLKKELAALQKHATNVGAVLVDAEKKQIESETVRLWLQDVETLALEADNVLDELNYESLRRLVKSRNQTVETKVCLFFFLSKHDITFRWRMSSKVRELNPNLGKFYQQAIDIGLIRMPAPQLPSSPALLLSATKSRETNSLPPPFVAGRAKEESDILGMLTGSTDKNVSVLPIVGMGGLGKTTLAKSVYNNEQISSQFTKKIWICVSDKFEVTQVFKLILESLSCEGKAGKLSQNVVVQKLQVELDGKRFLIVLDDVWEVTQSLWNDFFSSLVALNTVNGSCCLLTTRIQETAILVSTLVSTLGDPYLLEKLSDDHCWHILTQKATKGGELGSELDVHREQLLRRCNGLPLASSVMGGLLSLHKKEDWLSIVENKILKTSENLQNEIMPILKLSFDNLPSLSIKKCFAYCSIFEKDSELDGDELIELWMAEGFLNAERGTVMEKIGGDYLRILVQSSLLEEVKDELWERYYYQMHDLVHDLAESVWKREGNNQVLYVALDSNMEQVLSATSPSVRTLFVVDGKFDAWFLKFKYLRVLKLSERMNIEKLPNSICKLKHLHYLDLSRSNITILPESLCKLYNLQTLRLLDCKNLESLPQGMSKLISLKHLHYFSDDTEFQMPPEMGKLARLQTLLFFNVGKMIGRGIEELEHMNQIKGTLELRNLELVNIEGAERANLSGKQNLIDLKFCWTNTSHDDIDNYDDQRVLEFLRPPQNLHKLLIDNFMGVGFPQWFVKLSSLVELTLNDCERCTELPALGHLPSLKTLELRRLNNVNCIGDSFYCVEEGKEKGGADINNNCGSGQVGVARKEVFPALKTLQLRWMENLVEWKEVQVEDNGVLFPKLEELCIEHCPEIERFPQWFGKLSSLVALSLEDCKSCTELPTLGHLPSLKTLELRRLNNVNCIGDSSYWVEGFRAEEVLNVKSSSGSGQVAVTKVFPALQTLKLIDLANLVEWKEIEAVNDDVVFPKLEQLHIKSCDKLVFSGTPSSGLRGLEIDGRMQVLSGTPSSGLRRLEIDGRMQVSVVKDVVGRNATTLKDLKIKAMDWLSNLCDVVGQHSNYFTSLEDVEISNCTGLTDVPMVALQRCESLRQLYVGGCPNLISVPLDLQQFPSLSSLWFRDCPILFTKNDVPRGFHHLTNLRQLSIGPFSDDSIDLFDWSGLYTCSSTLQWLQLYGSPRMNPRLSQLLQHFTLLKNLSLIDFESLEILPDMLGNLASLGWLTLKNCPKLEYSPIVDSVARLTNLSYLRITNCALLRKSFSWRDFGDSVTVFIGPN